jgi:hypothetical protein
VNSSLAQAVQSRLAVLGQHHIMAGLFESPGEGLPDGLIIVHH